MKKLLSILCFGMIGCCLYVHRRAIAALIKGEEMPPAPKWHFWVKNRRA